ncbi:MAG: FkbM family methyltransferase, partial [Bryobacterales bacterium]|nr:FkbM family methyltransferase [Bryobacterales bacterium]
MVEPDPDRAANCRAVRPRSLTFHCAAVASPELREITFHQVGQAGVYSTTHMTDAHASRLASMGKVPRAMTVPARTLDSILEEVAAPAIDFVSIDVEGAEMDVLRGFDIERWQPAIVVVESNSKFRAPEIRDYFVRHGYAYQHSIDVNDFYLRVGAGAVTQDALNYARHRVRRRMARLGQNLRR